jgi:predicted signal transduction protein with EAL and GGDEF domain
MLRNTNPADAIRLGERLLASVRAPATINGRQFAVSACCGLTISTAEPAASPTLLLSQADVALYEAKKQNASGMAIFEPSMAAPGRRRAKVERALQLPNVLDDVEILYQPIVDLRSERIVSLEALARWTDPELGRISPAEFVPIAEQLNVIGGLSDQLTSEAMREALSWPEHIRLSVNLSAVQLSSPRSGQAVLRNLQRNRLSPHRLQVEVTETAIMADFPTARENLRALRSAGVKIVLDDFGAGYASISYLREMVFDEIKLDGSLIQNADSDPDRQRLLSALIGLCGALGLGAVAEHIETEEQMLLLKQLGCTAGQGFYLYRPLPAHAARKLLRGNLEALTQSAGRWKRAAA